MRPATLREYLDCHSYSDFGRRLKELQRRGYPGMDRQLKRHVKELVDSYLSSKADDKIKHQQNKSEMMKAIRDKVPR